MTQIKIHTFVDCQLGMSSSPGIKNFVGHVLKCEELNPRKKDSLYIVFPYRIKKTKKTSLTKL